MTVHLSKVAVGCDSVALLEQRQQAWTINGAGGTRIYRHRTRFMPKRAEELADGGSLYWIAKAGFIARQKILGFETVADADKTFTLIHLDPKPVPVLLTPRRYHQGWRYLEEADAPPDMTGSNASSLAAMPPKLLAELRHLALV